MIEADFGRLKELYVNVCGKRYSRVDAVRCVFRLRSKIERCELSLLDMRNYLFARQALLLLQLGQEEEVAKRCLAFLHNTLQVPLV